MKVAIRVPESMRGHGNGSDLPLVSEKKAGECRHVFEAWTQNERWISPSRHPFFRSRDSEERSARGFAIGLACNFYPTFGLGGFIAIFFARILGGNMAAAFIGGSILAAIWPVLFYLNIQVGSIFLRPVVPVEDLEDVTPQTVDALVWGQTFAIGSVINSLVVGLAGYFIFLALYARARPLARAGLRQRLRQRNALRFLKTKGNHVEDRHDNRRQD